jgi:cytochrome c oxidase subunit 2
VAHQKTGPAFTAPAATPAAGPPAATTAPAPSADTAMPPAQLVTGTVPIDELPGYAVPSTPIPAGLEVAGVTGDPVRGAQIYRTGACIACHVVQGVSAGVVGPSLTHVGSRTTIAAGLFPNDEPHLRAWIKNAPRMKPGSLMPALGKSDAVPGGYTDQQIADIAAYLLSLK